VAWVDIKPPSPEGVKRRLLYWKTPGHFGREFFIGQTAKHWGASLCYFNPDTIGTLLYGIPIGSVYQNVVCLNGDLKWIVWIKRIYDRIVIVYLMISN
jgi:hypothetical protein